MLTGGATFALVRGQNLVAETVAAADGFSLDSPGNSTQQEQQALNGSEERVFVNVGTSLKSLLYGALVGMSLFILSLAITFGRRAAHRPVMNRLESGPMPVQPKFKNRRGWFNLPKRPQRQRPDKYYEMYPRQGRGGVRQNRR